MAPPRQWCGWAVATGVHHPLWHYRSYLYEIGEAAGAADREGILTSEDAGSASNMDDGIIVSNHGGRSMTMVLTLEVPEPSPR
jgi:hypothetical protein